ncbi:ubiquitin hydrolase [Belliella baltica DSM 15883]|uniref:Ubiquitin hydrolase n=1 Tax=Belliella baltica (strain DSM 15883 / CIP 108006 / LMG 21964 / BA134) TaxID=866536 RepID=I3Z5Y4_BELBD|nr:thioredoxin-like domain-containing protein [Belliella baltica]AFL84652.1 ubiquitin hydrolase [Belliella baltica DSM 15883]
MKTTAILIAFILSFTFSAKAQLVENFNSVDILTGQNFELKNYAEAKAVILVFTNLSCPFSKLYENRIIDLKNKFSNDNMVFAMVNPHFGNDEDENKEAIEKRFAERISNFPILNDGQQALTKQLQVTKLPEVIVITPSQTGFSIAYRGAIDNNPQVPESSNMKYLENALESIQNKKNPSPSSSRPVGCNIRLIN